MIPIRLKVILTATSDEFLVYNGDTHKVITVGAQGKTLGYAKEQITTLLGQIQAMDAVNSATLEARMQTLLKDVHSISTQQPTIHRDEEGIFGWDITLYHR